LADLAKPGKAYIGSEAGDKREIRAEPKPGGAKFRRDRDAQQEKAKGATIQLTQRGSGHVDR